jgi:DNA invertase Pin-like site-specific DNA recombinase
MKKSRQNRETAILYIRTFSQEEGKITRSYLRQEKKLKSYCSKKDISVISIVKECASGASFKRKEFQKMFLALKSKNLKPNTLLFTSWDRFSRSASQSSKMIEELKKIGINAKALDGEFNLKSAENFELIYLQNNIKNRTNINDNINAVKKRGRWVGQVPFGYKSALTETKEKTIIPSDCATKVQWLFDEFSTGKFNIDEIARKFNATLPIFSRDKVLKILKSPVYYGKIAIERTSDKGQDFVAGAHLPIISEQLFYSVQAILESTMEKDGQTFNKY